MVEIIEEEETKIEGLEGLDSQFICMLIPRNLINCFKLGSLTGLGKE
jgi:hypothetical protein